MATGNGTPGEDQNRDEFDFDDFDLGLLDGLDLPTSSPEAVAGPSAMPEAPDTSGSAAALAVSEKVRDDADSTLEPPSKRGLPKESPETAALFPHLSDDLKRAALKTPEGYKPEDDLLRIQSPQDPIWALAFPIHASLPVPFNSADQEKVRAGVKLRLRSDTSPITVGLPSIISFWEKIENGTEPVNPWGAHSLTVQYTMYALMYAPRFSFVDAEIQVAGTKRKVTLLRKVEGQNITWVESTVANLDMDDLELDDLELDGDDDDLSLDLDDGDESDNTPGENEAASENWTVQAMYREDRNRGIISFLATHPDGGERRIDLLSYNNAKDGSGRFVNFEAHTFPADMKDILTTDPSFAEFPVHDRASTPIGRHLVREQTQTGTVFRLIDPVERDRAAAAQEGTTPKAPAEPEVAEKPKLFEPLITVKLPGGDTEYQIRFRGWLRDGFPDELSLANESIDAGWEDHFGDDPSTLPTIEVELPSGETATYNAIGVFGGLVWKISREDYDRLRPLPPLDDLLGISPQEKLAITSHKATLLIAPRGNQGMRHVELVCKSDVQDFIPLVAAPGAIEIGKESIGKIGGYPNRITIEGNETDVRIKNLLLRKELDVIDVDGAELGVIRYQRTTMPGGWPSLVWVALPQSADHTADNANDRRFFGTGDEINAGKRPAAPVAPSRRVGGVDETELNSRIFLVDTGCTAAELAKKKVLRQTIIFDSDKHDIINLPPNLAGQKFEINLQFGVKVKGASVTLTLQKIDMPQGAVAARHKEMITNFCMTLLVGRTNGPSYKFARIRLACTDDQSVLARKKPGRFTWGNKPTWEGNLLGDRYRDDVVDDTETTDSGATRSIVFPTARGVAAAEAGAEVQPESSPALPTQQARQSVMAGEPTRESDPIPPAGFELHYAEGTGEEREGLHASIITTIQGLTVNPLPEPVNANVSFEYFYTGDIKNKDNSPSVKNTQLSLSQVNGVEGFAKMNPRLSAAVFKAIETDPRFAVIRITNGNGMTARFLRKTTPDGVRWMQQEIFSPNK